MTRILGIDPGLAATGYGIIERNGTGYVHVEHGCIQTSSTQDVGSRLATIYTAIFDAVGENEISGAGVESLYFAQNTSSALPVAQARGVVLLALYHQHIQATEYSPQAIKQALVGYGRAEKKQVQQMVRMILGLTEQPQPNHAADALAAAICHANTAQFCRRLPRGDIQ